MSDVIRVKAQDFWLRFGPKGEPVKVRGATSEALEAIEKTLRPGDKALRFGITYIIVRAETKA